MRLRTAPLAVGLLIGLIIGWTPERTSYTSLHSGLLTQVAPETPRAMRGVNTATRVDPLGSGWLEQAKASTVVVVTSLGTYGSGVAIAREGKDVFILTARHVVDKPLVDPVYDIIRYTRDTKAGYKGIVIYKSNIYDVAILKVEDGGDINTAKLAQFTPSEGERVYACGYPGSVKVSIITVGVILHDCLSCNEVQHTAGVYYGSSGGPVFNNDGEVIGISIWLDWHPAGFWSGDRAWMVPVVLLREALKNAGVR